ncbi:lebercilin-like protein isoform X2 [Hyla sarda]|uniref:lebercilin-like protein isoform X2 n=1 Tax=Hyla sarda TaxID=327740 RepID=UPI0024C23F35|nr:lebercilin-like protein isoform X2 [Hyla sarda]
MSLEVSGGNKEWSPEPSADPEERSISSPNDPAQSPCSHSPSTSDRSETSCSQHSISDSSSSETPERITETQNTPEKTPKTIKNTMCQTFPKVDKGFSWRKSPPWKRPSLKPQHLPIPTQKTESDVTRRILSAQVRKIKELKDELCDVQRTLEAVNSENRLLTRLQHRHMKALQKYESPESSIHHLIARHGNEVRTLRETLRTTQESERGLSLKLKMAENELLKAKESLWRLQRLSEDKNLAEREELNNKLSSLLIKMEIDSTKVKVLEKQLHLTAQFYDRQLSIESKKASEARDISEKLQDEILSLQQTIKEKEKELHIKNIYAHRMPRNIWKHGGLYGLTSKSTQTESEMFTHDEPRAHEDEEYSTRQNKNIESENDSMREEDNNPQMTREEAATHDVSQDQADFLQIDGKYEEEDNDADKPSRLLLEEDLEQEDIRHYEKNQQEDEGNKNEIDSGRKVESSDTRSFLPRLSRRYIFTAATENLHQGFPATGPIPSLSKAHSCNSLKRDNSLGHKELSLPKIKAGNCKEKKEERPDVSVSDRKKTLMEELFGPRYGVKNSFSGDFVTSGEEFSL